MMVESYKSEFLIDGGEIVGIVYSANAEGYEIQINREKLSVAYGGENVIVNGSPLEGSDPWRCCICSCRI